MWRFINTGFRSGKFNMEYDESLAVQLSEGKGTPTVRVFGWSPHAISLGYHQDESGLDLHRSKEAGIDVVRRPTGGRAILHAHELTYCVIMPAAGRSVLQVYEYISWALLAALRHLGVNAEHRRSSPGAAMFYKGDSAVSCFASTSKYEVQFHGKKIIGSAQRRYAPRLPGGDEIVLQHGSVLLGPQHRKLVDFILPSHPRSREIMRHTLERNTIEVETILQRKVDFEEAAGAVRRGFEDAWGIELGDSMSESRLPDEVLVERIG